MSITKYIIMGIFVATTVSVAIVAACVLWPMPSNWLLQEANSPAHIGSGAFVSDAGSFAGCSVYVYARDPKTPKPNAPILIGGPYASDGSVKMEQAIWSSDGSVLAVRAKVGEGAGHGFRKYYGKFFVSAYDFRTHGLVSTTSPRGVKSREIGRLLSSRGGEGVSACSAPYSSSGQPVSGPRLWAFTGLKE